jgi:hypothetical protein
VENYCVVEVAALVVASVGGEVGRVELAALLGVDGWGIEMRKSIVKRLMEIIEDWDKTVSCTTGTCAKSSERSEAAVASKN